MDAEVVFTFTSGLLTVLSLAVAACKILRPWRGQARGLLAQCCHRFRRRTPAPEEAEVEQRVREECLRRRVERASTFLTLFSVPSTYFSFSQVWSLAVGMQWMPPLPMAMVQANMFAKCTAAFFPSLLTPRVIDVMYGQSLLTMVCVEVFAGPSNLASSYRLIGLVQFLYWGFFDLKPWINTIGALILVLAEVAAVVWVGAPPELLPPTSMTYLSALVSLIGVDYCLERSVRFEILAADSKSELTAIQTLLNSICDVVVSLDGQLRLKQHSSKLADVLLQPLRRSFAGADLRDYMASDMDRKVFSEHVRMKDGDTAQANVFHARLRDSTQSHVAMEFFTVGFKSHSGEQHHIVGMREYTDIQPLACQRCEPQPPPTEVAMPRSSQAEVGQPQGERGHLAPVHEHADVQPLACQRREPQLPPVQAAMPHSSRGEGPTQPQHGTPYSVEQCDLRAHRGNPAVVAKRPRSRGERSGTDPDSNSDSGLGLPRHSVDLEAPDPAPTPLPIETSEVAKVATTNYLLMSWVVREARRSCCPMHAAIASLQRVAASMAEKGCSPDYGPFTRWQCKRCGIKADEYRDLERRRSRRCLLCRDLGGASFAPRANASATSSTAL